MGQPAIEPGIVGAIEGNGVGALPAPDQVLAEAGGCRALRLRQGQGLPADAELREPEAEAGDAADGDRLTPEQGAVCLLYTSHALQ